MKNSFKLFILAHKNNRGIHKKVVYTVIMILLFLLLIIPFSIFKTYDNELKRFEKENDSSKIVSFFYSEKEKYEKIKNKVEESKYFIKEKDYTIPFKSGSFEEISGIYDDDTYINPYIYEKDINLNISLYLKEKLESNGATVYMTRDGDYDLSTPNAIYRKKSDFDNRINLINNSNADIYLSIHLNYLSDFKYYGPQVFYNGKNIYFANIMQDVLNKGLNSNRKIKTIPKDTYMYSKLKVNGLLIECGFLSNYEDRQKLITNEYQKKVANLISNGVIKYFS